MHETACNRENPFKVRPRTINQRDGDIATCAPGVLSGCKLGDPEDSSHVVDPLDTVPLPPCALRTLYNTCMMEFGNCHHYLSFNKCPRGYHK